MTEKQVLARLDTIRGKIFCLLHDETISRAFLARVIGEELFHDLQLVGNGIEALLDDKMEAK